MYQQLLHNTSIARDRSYICIQPPTAPSPVSAIPFSQQDAHASLIRHQFAALWQPRHVTNVPQGISYAAGQCLIQIGELRSVRDGPQSGGPLSPGVVVCISTMVGTDDDEWEATTAAAPPAEEEDAIDFDYPKAIIRDCWSTIKQGRDLGKSEVKEVMMAPEYVSGTQEKDAAVRMWCEALRMRG